MPILVTPYGFPIEAFTPRRSHPPADSRFCPSGTHDLRKGTPYLLEAWKRAAIPDAELHLVGPLRLAKPFVDDYAGTFRHWPHVPKSELGARYAAADLLVVSDARRRVRVGHPGGDVLAGRPSSPRHAAAAQSASPTGSTAGSVPPRDIDALVERFRACAADRDRTFTRWGVRPRARAERWTWRDAGAALVKRA